MARARASEPPRIPKRLKVGHATYDVSQASNEPLGHEAHAIIVVDQRRIVLEPGLHPDKAREVLLHEVLHAVVSAAGLEWEADDEEAIVSRFTGPLLDALRSNPQFISFLTHKE